MQRKRDNKGRFKKASPRLPSFAEATAGKDFPQILRKIPAVQLRWATIHIWRWLIVLVIVSILLLQLVQLGQLLYQNYNEAQVKQAEKQKIEADIARWEKIVEDRPNYRDGYFELAVLTYRLDRIYETRFYLRKVFLLDPNYQPARELEEKLRY